MADVTISGIYKSFGSVEVIRDLSIAIEDGEFVALVGPSGCGKSTLLRMIAGLEDPSSGEIAIAGERVNDWLPKDRNVAMVFQSYALYPHMTVGQNMSFALELEKRPKHEIQAAVAEASSILGLDDYLDRKPKALSGGQRQRVAMGRAIVRNPAVFLFDEPLSNLDAKLRTVMRKEVKLLHQRLKTTSIYVTHDQTEAMTMADRIVVMQGGLIEQVGSPMELYKKPCNLFVAGFIGAPQMNLFTGTVELSGDLPVLNCSAGVLPLPGGYSLSDGQKLVMGIRPEHLLNSGEGAFAAGVNVIEPMGSETHLTCAVGEDEVRLVVDAEMEYALGDVLRPDYEQRNCHLFDAGNGLRLNAQPEAG